MGKKKKKSKLNVSDPSVLLNASINEFVNNETEDSSSSSDESFDRDYNNKKASVSDLVCSLETVSHEKA